MTINFRFVVFQLGLLMLVLSLAMGAIALWSWYDWYRNPGLGESRAIESMGIATVLGLVIGLGLWGVGRRERDAAPGRREALLLVAVTWVLGAAFAALPYHLWWWTGGDASHPFASFTACYFEAMSGLTTTGATVLSNIAELPDGLLLWRATTHWLGGLGIVVLFVAVLPTLGVGGKKLFHTEAPGPQQTGVRPRIAEAARFLWLIYLAITLAAILLLRVAGMNWFDSVCHSFAMVSTGGLSTRDASIGHYDSWVIDVICIVFMLLAGVNFALYFQAARGRWGSVWKDVELRIYLILKVMVILAVAVNIYGETIITTAGRAVQAGVLQALQYASFQTVALHTGTGYATADYEPWPFVSRALLIGLMFIGGCAGSTAGGVKVIRFWIALKVIYTSLEKTFRPQVVRPLQVGRGVVDDDLKLAAVTYFLLILLLFSLGAVLIAIAEAESLHIDFMTAMSASISTLCNVGPGLGAVGPTDNYGWFNDPSLAVMSLLMLLGRLEVFVVVVLLSPRFWRSE